MNRSFLNRAFNADNVLILIKLLNDALGPRDELGKYEIQIPKTRHTTYLGID